MADWSALRRRAQEHHARLSARLRPDTLLPTAENLLNAAEEDTDLMLTPVRAGDPLLAGAFAVLDRAKDSIWYVGDAALPPERRRLVLAHEFAHFWLHPDLAADACQPADIPEDFAPISPTSQTALIAEGYSPAERREIEANLFAAEFLLPAPLLRRALTEGWDARRIAAHVGLPESCVLSQLALAITTTESPALSQSPVSSSTPEQTTLARAWAATSSRLDPGQKAAAEISSGPVLVDAGPGTGKTRTLIARMIWLLAHQGIAPENLLALTFSNRAAEEMRTRLREAVGDIADRVWIGTFHAFGFELLRKDGSRLGLPLVPRLVDTADAIALLERHLDRLPLREFEYLSEPTLPFPDVLHCISRAKDELLTPREYAQAALRQIEVAADEKARRAGEKSLEIAGIYAVYQELLEEEGMLDFGDLIRRAVELLDTAPDVRARWQAQFPHILADEYQDINRASAQLVQRLAGDARGLWAVGDLRQAIYRFRGASPANVREFDRDFPGGRRLRLGINYRSRPAIVACFGAQGAGLTDSAAENAVWEAQREAAGTTAITVALATDEDAQANGLAEQIQQHRADGVAFRDQAVLCRTNAQCADLADRLQAHSVPVQHTGSLLDRDEVKDVLALLSLASEPEGIALARVARFAEYAIPEADVSRLLAAAQTEERAFPAALKLADDLPDLTKEGRAGLRLLWTHLEPITYRGGAWLLLSRYLFETGGYLHSLLAADSPENRQKARALAQMLTFAQNAGRKPEIADSPAPQLAFLNYIRHLIRCGEERTLRLPDDVEGLDGVRLMTMHQAKGLEFPIVYLPNLAKDMFPPRKAARMAAPLPAPSDENAPPEADEEIANEASLFFVALSRARDHLILARPARRGHREIAPSLFWTEIEPILETIGADRIDWTQNSPPAPAEDDALGAKVEISLSALEQYRRCPRQFYYRRVAHLPERAMSSEYLRYHRCLQETLDWVQAERSAGRAPLPEALHEHLDQCWQEHFGPTPSAFARLLRERAGEMLQHTRSDEPLTDALPPLTLTAELEHGAITLRGDQVQRLPDGRMRVVQQRRGRRKADDHTDPRLALLRHAVRQYAAEGTPEIALDYLQEGTQIEVPASPRYEPARVEKFNQALRGIRAAHFPPQPDNAQCAQCPYLFICPI